MDIDDDDEEQPIALAFTDHKVIDTPSLLEFVYDGDIFWGTISKNFIEKRCTTRELTTRNNIRLESPLLPFLPACIRNIVLAYLHYHC